MDKTQEDIERGRLAEDLLNNEVFVGVFDEMKNAIIQQWKQTVPNDTENRERLFLMLKVTDKIHEHITLLINNGKVASHNLLLEQENRNNED